MGQADRPTWVRYQVLAVACSLAVLTYVQRQGFVAGTPEIRRHLALDDEQMGYLLSGWLVAYGIFQVPGGLLGDRLGARHLLTLLVLGWSIVLASVAVIALAPAGVSIVLGSVAGIALTPSGVWWAFALLFALRFLFGAFQAGGFPGLARVVADWIPSRQRGFAQGLIWTSSRLGGFAAPLAVAWLFGVLEDWAIPFVMLGSLGLFWSAGFSAWFRNRPRDMPQVNAAELALIESSQPAAPAPHSPLQWSALLASRNVWGLCLMYGFLGFSGNFFTNWLPDYLEHHRNITGQTRAWITALPLAFGIVSCLLGGVSSDWLIRRTGRRNLGRRLVGTTSMALAALAMLASIWVEEPWLLAVVFSTAFFFNDATMGPAWASCADVGERSAGALSGAMNMTGSFFAAIAMSLAGALFHRGLDDAVFVIFAVSYLLSGIAWLVIDVTQPLHASLGPAREPDGVNRAPGG
jgi:sugar phosphate permease